MRNIGISDNKLGDEAILALQSRLPLGWAVDLASDNTAASDGSMIVEVQAPDRRSCMLVIVQRQDLTPKGALSFRLGDVPMPERRLVDKRKTVPPDSLLVARYLSEATRSVLKAHELNYLDLTGNVRIVLSKPGLFIDTQGATSNPNREERAARTLRGAKTGRLVRMLIDCKKAMGVRALAKSTGIDPGYVSRVLAFLDEEALIKRVGHGRIESIDWVSLLRRWALATPIESRGTIQTFLDPRGLSSFITRLEKSKEQYAVTATLAAADFAPIAPARLAVVWIRDASEAAQRLGLRPADAGANVLLIEPNDDSVFEGSAERDGLCYAAPSQVVADLLTSPGRGPSEGEEMLEWMQKHEDQWRG